MKAVIWENLHLRSEGAAERWEIQEQRLLGKPEKSKSEAEPGSSAGRLLSDKDAAGAGGCRGRGVRGARGSLGESALILSVHDKPRRPVSAGRQALTFQPLRTTGKEKVQTHDISKN